MLKSQWELPAGPPCCRKAANDGSGVKHLVTQKMQKAVHRWSSPHLQAVTVLSDLIYIQRAEVACYCCFIRLVFLSGVLPHDWGL